MSIKKFRDIGKKKWEMELEDLLGNPDYGLKRFKISKDLEIFKRVKG